MKASSRWKSEAHLQLTVPVQLRVVTRQLKIPAVIKKSPSSRHHVIEKKMIPVIYHCKRYWPVQQIGDMTLMSLVCSPILFTLHYISDCSLSCTIYRPYSYLTDCPAISLRIMGICRTGVCKLRSAKVRDGKLRGRVRGACKLRGRKVRGVTMTARGGWRIY